MRSWSTSFRSILFCWCIVTISQMLLVTKFSWSPTHETAFWNGAAIVLAVLPSTGVWKRPCAAKKMIQNTLRKTNTSAHVRRLSFLSLRSLVPITVSTSSMS